MSRYYTPSADVSAFLGIVRIVCGLAIFIVLFLEDVRNDEPGLFIVGAAFAGTIIIAGIINLLSILLLHRQKKDGRHESDGEKGEAEHARP
jgi:uncharacterized membrane protein HdeD (DUF308 family)